MPERCSWVARAGPRSRSIRAAVTAHRRPGQTGQTVPSHGAGGWKSAGQVLWRRLSLACRQPPARCPPSMGRERRSPFLSSDGKGAHPCGFVTSSEPSFPARATPPSPIALKVEFQPMNLFIFIFFGGGARGPNIQSLTPELCASPLSLRPFNFAGLWIVLPKLSVAKDHFFLMCSGV